MPPPNTAPGESRKVDTRAHLFLGLGPLRVVVVPPACSASALIVVLTLFMAVCMLSLFLEAGPSETARALTPNSSAAPAAAAADWVGATVTSIAVFELPVSDSCSSVVRSDEPTGACLGG